MSELTGKMLGRYRLESLLGTGGMAEVYRAADTQLGRAVAIKVILPSYAREASFRERFEREARLVAALQHPHILPLYDIGEADGLPYLVMPFVEGGTLADRLAAGPQPPELAVRWISEVASALDAAHSAGILHRDVKPSNVLLDRNDRALLADFGIAQAAGQATKLTATGAVIGTPGYMAPELVRGEPASPASDRYALAVLAFELLSGRPPFTAEHPLAVLHRQLSDPVPPITQRTPTAPRAADAVFDAALAKMADERPPSAQSFAERLAGVWNEQTLAPTLALPGRHPVTAGVARPVTHVTTGPPASRRLVLAAALLAAGALAGFGLYRWTRAAGIAGQEIESTAEQPSADSTETTPEQVEQTAPAITPAQEPPAARIPPRPSGDAPPLPPIGASTDAPGPEPDSEASPASDVLLELSGAPAESDAAPGDNTAAGGTDAAPGPFGGRRGPGGRLRAAGAARSAFPGIQALRVLAPASRARFEQIATEAREALERSPRDPLPRAVALYAEAGLAALRGDDAASDSALRQLAEIVAGLPPQMLGLGPLALLVRRPAGSFEAWESAAVLGDPRGDGLASADAHLAEQPGDGRALYGRGVLHALHGDSAAARADLEAGCNAGFLPACRRADPRRRAGTAPP